MNTLVQQLAETLIEASASKTPLRIVGGGTKDFYGNPTTGETLSTSAYRGIIEYEPTELVITARAGTPLAEIESAMKEKGQMLAFEPPHFGTSPSPLAPTHEPPRRAGSLTLPSPPGRRARDEGRDATFTASIRDARVVASLPLAGEGSGMLAMPKMDAATLGGCIAAGLSGPRRAYAGAVRDLVLGVRILDGKGTDLRFGGQVMKNVAGYDVSRLMAGAMGTLGVILEVSLKTLPLPAAEITLHQQRNEADAIRLMNEWAGQPLPISATAWCGGELSIRLSGAASAVEAARTKLGGNVVDAAQAEKFWHGIRDHTDPYLAHGGALWRLSVKSTAPAITLPGQQMIEWSGALRWLHTDAAADVVRNAAAAADGHATLFRGGECAEGVFHPLSPTLAAIHRKLKQAFDPAGILNRGRLYNNM